MQVNKAQNTGAAGRSKRPKKTGEDPRFSAAVAPVSSADPATPTTAATPISSLDALLAIQGVDADQHHAQADVQQAGNVLDALEQVRRGILLGAIPVGRLQQLSARLEARAAAVCDPALADIMTDIVLRARVELAKVGIYK
ncbi:MAG: flagellar assembly protein FliX [Pseudomonadota bacterium]